MSHYLTSKVPIGNKKSKTDTLDLLQKKFTRDKRKERVHVRINKRKLNLENPNMKHTQRRNNINFSRKALNFSNKQCPAHHSSVIQASLKLPIIFKINKPHAYGCINNVESEENIYSNTKETQILIGRIKVAEEPYNFIGHSWKNKGHRNQVKVILSVPYINTTNKLTN